MKLFGIDVGVGTSISDKLYYLVYGLMTKAGFICWGGSSGGGGSPAPTQSTSYNTNIPEYAKPYVTTMLGATQQQLFEGTPTEGGGYDITGFRPYQPYSTNVNDYFAGFSPLQQQAQAATAGLQTPSQYGAATGLAGVSGLGSLGVARQAAGAGSQYAAQAQDPNAMRGYMSPYMQNVVDYQKSQALRDYAMAQPYMQAKAVGQGAFGGNRLALQQSEAQRGLMSQLQGIEATGAQQAFQNAQQAQQFGANLGLQGYGQALQGFGQANQAAGTLGQLGTAQLGAQQNIINAQSQMGAQQQALEQSKINQAIQDYAIQQQYPLMQLGFMSNMLRGLPLQAQTTQLYQAQPSTTQQAVGLLGAGASLLGRKEGGIINAYKEGGTVGYKYGGAIPEPKLAGMADNLSVAQLQQRLRDPQLTDRERQIFAAALQEKMQEEARMGGIAQAGGPAFENQGMAGGGIIAFADEGEVKDPEKLAEQINLIGSQLDTVNKEAYGRMGPGSKQRAFSPEKVAEYENLKKRQSELKGEYADLMTRAGLDKPAVGYRSGLAPTTLYPNSVEQAVLGTKPEEKQAAPTAGEFKAFDDATERFLKEQKTKGASGTASASEGSKASGSASPLMQATAGKSLADFLAQRRELGPKGQVGEDFEKFITERLGSSADRLSRDERMAMAKGFLKFGSTAAPGGIGQAMLAGLGEYATGVEAARKAQDTMELEMQKMRKDLEVARRAEERGDVEGAQKAYDSAADRQNRIQAAQISASAAGQTQRAEQAKIERLMKENPGMTYKDALQFVAGAGRSESNDINALKTAIAAKQNDLYAPGITKEDRARIQQEISALQQRLVAIGMSGVTSGGGAPTGGKVDTNNPLLKG